MKPIFRRFFLESVIISLVLVIAGTVLFLSLLSRYYHELMPFILIGAFLINLLSFRQLFAARRHASNPMLAITRSFAVKFLSYLLLTVILFLIEKGKSDRIILISSLFLLYIVYTWHEVNAFIRYEKAKNK